MFISAIHTFVQKRRNGVHDVLGFFLKKKTLIDEEKCILPENG